MAYYRCGPTAIGSRSSWAPVTSPEPRAFDRPLSGNFDRIFNSFERTNAFEYVRSIEDGKGEERSIGHSDIVVNRKLSSSYSRADCALAAQTPSAEDEEFYREKILYSQARQLFPLQEDLADWINKTIGITYLTGENFLDVLDNGVELCELAAVVHARAKDALDQGLLVGPVPQIRGRCWQRAARRSFFSRDNTENFITFCRELGVHENLLFESDDLVLHNQPRQVILCLLEVARLATRFGVEPPGLVQLEKEIALEERDSGLDSASWQFRDVSPVRTEKTNTSDLDETQLSAVDNADAESTKSEGTVASTDSDIPLKPTNELDKRVQLVTRLMERGCNCSSGKCSKLLKVKKVGEGRYNIAGRNVFIRLLKGRHMMVRVGGGWDTLEHFLSRHEPCQVRLVTPSSLATPAPPRPRQPRPADTADQPPTPLDTKLSSGKSSPIDPKLTSGKSSPIDTKLTSGKTSPIEKDRPSSKTSSRKTSPIHERRTSTPNKPSRSALSLPLRKSSQPASTPATPSTPPAPLRKSLTTTTLVNARNKSRSMSLALAPEKKSFCGTERLNQRKKSASAATTPTDTLSRKTRSQSLATTPLNDKKTLPTNVKKTRSMSLANPIEFKPLGNNKSISLSINGAMTQAAIEETIRLSLAASIADETCAKKPYLHIKAKYRSPPPREVPPR